MNPLALFIWTIGDAFGVFVLAVCGITWGYFTFMDYIKKDH
jgi:hypothetical protein